MDFPLVTVLMPVYNCQSYVEDAILSILEQTYTNFEFIIIDDASTDTTLDIVKKYQDLRIQLIEKQENTGYTKSLNQGLNLAKGKYIARMDGDDISLPNRFAEQVNFMESHPEVVVCGTNYEFISTNKLVMMPETHDAIKISLLEGTCFGHPTVMIRKDIFDQHNLLYDVEKEPAEDYALWVNMLKYGQMHNLQNVLLYYRVHDEQVSQKRRISQLKSKVSTRLTLLRYLGIQFQTSDGVVLKKVLTEVALNFSEVLIFIRITNQLLSANYKILFFNPDKFKLYLNTLESKVITSYFLKRNHFSPKIYMQYFKLKDQSIFKFSLKTHIIFLFKCLLFLGTKKVNTSSNDVYS